MNNTNLYTNEQVVNIIDVALRSSQTKVLPIKTAEEIFYRLQRLSGLRPATIDCAKSLMKTNYKYFEKHNISTTDDLTKDFILQYIDYLFNKGNSNCYINKLLGVINQICKKLHQNGYLQEKDLGIKKLPEETKEIEILSEEQIIQLMNYISTKSLEHQLVFRLILETGVRRTELIKIKISNINIKEKKIFLVHTKNHDPRNIFLSDVTIELLNAYLKNVNKKVEFLFHNKKTSKQLTTTFIDSLFNRTKKALVFDKLGPHLLRHTYCSALAHLNNVNIRTIQKLMGHKTLNVTMRYIHLVNQEELAETSIAFNPISNL